MAELIFGKKKYLFEIVRAFLENKTNKTLWVRQYHPWG